MTADLIARCRTALAESDETARLAQTWWAEPARWIAAYEDTSMLGVHGSVSAHIAANDPSTRLALNRALTVVLDGIAATLDEHGRVYIANVWACPRCDGLVRPPCDDANRAAASLAAIAEALVVTEEGP